MFCRVNRVSWMLLILFLSTKLRLSESLKDNNAEIRKRVKREAAPANSTKTQINAETVDATAFERSQVTDDSLEFDIVQSAFIEASDQLKKQEALDEELIAQNEGRFETSPEFEHFLLLKIKPEAIPISKVALTQELATLSIQKQSGGKAELSTTISNTIVSSFTPCPPEPTCSTIDDIYRSYDGSCNNKEPGKTSWGKSFTATRRLRIPPNYADRISSPRVSVVNSEPLPSARFISSQLSQDINKPNDKYTLSITQWGQFVDHDITRTPTAVLTSSYGETGIIKCCTDDGQHLPPSTPLHSECFPIDIPINDPFYSQFNQSCMSFVRSSPAPSIDCTLGYRNQMNQNSHYLDGSMVYGSSAEEASNLRTLQNGLLKVSFINLLPEDGTTPRFDYIAGDSRVNEQPQLPLIHTLWLRQHNKVATQLQILNPTWDDEKLYQIARRIIVALIQHIVYNEWLPIILGTETMDFYRLVPQISGYSTGYSVTKDASIANEFSTVAFRFGHTLVPGDVQLHGNAEYAGFVKLSENFFNSALGFGETTFNQLLRGLFLQPMENFDQCLPDDLTNKLYKTSQRFGLDLVALNTQRGRDHGIGTYSQLRDYCKMRPVTDFSSLEDYINPEIVAKLKIVYNDHVEDVDAFIAGIAENPDENGGILGPLFNCIVAEQFVNLKYGDRFYYENEAPNSFFTPEQLNEIRKITWARIICDNTEGGIEEIQPHAFKLPDEALNAKVLCTDTINIPTIDLTLWAE